uniref:Uncharacterized protein n=1 Tax=Mycena chlorophos TaxID=658473 RepID=A0ABQ0LAI1_MYCCL|nr:predicted protein [Mycena chlorophos]
MTTAQAQESCAPSTIPTLIGAYARTSFTTRQRVRRVIGINACPGIAIRRLHTLSTTKKHSKSRSRRRPSPSPDSSHLAVLSAAALGLYLRGDPVETVAMACTTAADEKCPIWVEVWRFGSDSRWMQLLIACESISKPKA